MSYDRVRRTIENKLDDEWETTPIRWPDIPFNPDATLAYIAPHILFGNSAQASLPVAPDSTRLYRTMPVLMIQCFTPELEGSGPCLRLADALADMFRSLVIPIQATDTLYFYDPAIERVGVTNGWLQYNCNVTFRWDRFLQPATEPAAPIYVEAGYVEEGYVE